MDPFAGQSHHYLADTFADALKNVGNATLRGNDKTMTVSPSPTGLEYVSIGKQPFHPTEDKVLAERQQPRAESDPWDRITLDESIFMEHTKADRMVREETDDDMRKRQKLNDGSFQPVQAFDAQPANDPLAAPRPDLMSFGSIDMSSLSTDRNSKTRAHRQRNTASAFPWMQHAVDSARHQKMMSTGMIDTSSFTADIVTSRDQSFAAGHPLKSNQDAASHPLKSESPKADSPKGHQHRRSHSNMPDWMRTVADALIKEEQKEQKHPARPRAKSSSMFDTGSLTPDIEVLYTTAPIDVHPLSKSKLGRTDSTGSVHRRVRSSLPQWMQEAADKVMAENNGQRLQPNELTTIALNIECATEAPTSDLQPLVSLPLEPSSPTGPRQSNLPQWMVEAAEMVKDRVTDPPLAAPPAVAPAPVSLSEMLGATPAPAMAPTSSSPVVAAAPTVAPAPVSLSEIMGAAPAPMPPAAPPVKTSSLAGFDASNASELPIGFQPEWTDIIPEEEPSNL